MCCLLQHQQNFVLYFLRNLNAASLQTFSPGVHLVGAHCVEHVAEYEESLYERLEAQHADVLDAIRTTGQLSADTEAALKSALENFTRDFLKTK